MEEDEQVQENEFNAGGGEDYPSKDNYQSYEICKNTKAENRMNKLISQTEETFGLDKDNAILLLQFFHWNYDNMSDRMLSSEKEANEIRILAGIASSVSGKILKDCPICGHPINTSKDTMEIVLPCGHQGCYSCILEYVKCYLMVKRCVDLQCWICKCKIPFSVFAQLPTEDFLKYKKWLIKSYTDESKTIKWCPNENCEYFVEFPDMLSIDIKCFCGYIFCFKCGKESHKPTLCDLRKSWDFKNSSESEDVLWIQANTKPCPACKKYIEKNEGCNHMTCSQCKHEFCWICFADWPTHGSSYYQCIKFQDNKATEGLAKTIDDESARAKNELNKYVFYFDRFAGQHKSKILARKEKEIAKEFCTKFSDKFKFPLSELQFLIDAADVVIDARRILENTYIAMFYCDNPKEKDLVEFLLERLQFYSDQLQEKSEAKKEELFAEEDSHSKFYVYKNEITGKMSLVKSAFENFTKSMEKGFTN